MKKLTLSFAVLGLAFLIVHAGCGDDEGSGGSGDTTTSSTGSPASTTGTPSSTGNTSSSTSTGGSGFTFDQTAYGDYVQVERHGAVEAGTVGIALAAGLGPAYPNAFDPDGDADIAIRDDYNASNPVEDAASMWVPEIANSVTTLQSVLNDDLLALGLTPADLNDAVAQAGPVIIPDTIKYDPADPVGYPNGRALEDPVVDITIAAALLDLSVHPITLLADLPLNPPANDVPFKTTFPYLADPH
jgi:hypothetical protein